MLRRLLEKIMRHAGIALAVIAFFVWQTVPGVDARGHRGSGGRGVSHRGFSGRGMPSHSFSNARGRLPTPSPAHSNHSFVNRSPSFSVPQAKSFRAPSGSRQHAGPAGRNDRRSMDSNRTGVTLHPGIGNRGQPANTRTKRDSAREKLENRNGSGFFSTGRSAAAQFPGLADRAQVTLPGLTGGGAKTQLQNRFPDLNRDNLRQQIDAAGDSRAVTQQKYQTWRQRQQDERGRTPERRQQLEDRLSEVDRDQWRDRRDENREDRQQFREQRQDDWQQYRTNAREDWQNWYDDKYYYHYGWYRGGWHYGWDRYWHQMWYEYPAAVAVGLTCWGINSMAYSFGTTVYVNPYYAGPASGGALDYSQPQFVPSQPEPDGSSSPPPEVPEQGLQIFEQARTAFHSGDYRRARQLADAALKSMPHDALVQEFRALTFFAQQDYTDAATVLHSVLAVSPGWDWTTMSQLYPNLETYTKHLRALEQWTKDHPSAPEGHFVLAYHYLTCGHQDDAAKQLELVVQELPDDHVSARLLNQLTGQAPQPGSDAPGAPVAESDEARSEPQKLNPPELQVEQVEGTWSAKTKTARYGLELKDSGRFEWTYEHASQTQTVAGVYALKGTTLALEPDGGGVMLADIRIENESLKFEQVGTDKTLTFEHP